MAVTEGVKDTVTNGIKATRAITGAMILGSTSPSLSSSNPPSTPGSSNSSRVGTPPSVAPHSVADIERCNCCTIDDFWKIYDSFQLMDKRECGSVRRCDFYQASTEHVTLEMRRTITRGDLHQRFRESAAEMTLAELLQRIWPTANDADRATMNHWAKLRDASSILSSSSFRGTRQDLKQIFDLLDADGGKTLSISELTRARILTKAEAQKLLRDWYKRFNDSSSNSGSDQGLGLTFNEFCMMTQKHLADKYAKHEENGTWQNYCRSAFHASRTATNELHASKEAGFLSPDKSPKTPSSEKPKRRISLKAVATSIKLANSMFHGHMINRDVQDQSNMVMAH